MLPVKPKKANLIFAAEWLGIWVVATLVSVLIVGGGDLFLRGFVFVLTFILLWWVVIRFDLLPAPENVEDVLSGRLGQEFGQTPNRAWYTAPAAIHLLIVFGFIAAFRFLLGPTIFSDVGLGSVAITLLKPVSDLLLATVPSIKIAVFDLLSSGRVEEVHYFTTIYTFNFLVSFLMVTYWFSFYFYATTSLLFYTKAESTGVNTEAGKRVPPDAPTGQPTVAQTVLNHRFGEIFILIVTPMLIWTIYTMNPLKNMNSSIDEENDIITQTIMVYVGPVFMFYLILFIITVINRRHMLRKHSLVQITPRTEE